MPPPHAPSNAEILHAILTTDFDLQELKDALADNEAMAWAAHASGAYGTARVFMTVASLARQVLAYKGVLEVIKPKENHNVETTESHPVPTETEPGRSGQAPADR